MYLVGDPGAAEGCNHLNGAEGDVEEDRGEGVEAERLDDQGSESRYATTRDPIPRTIGVSYDSGMAE